MRVFGSCRSSAFSESPTRFAARIPIASRRPHSALRASPTAARPHAIPTVAISAIDASLPISWNRTRASGFRRQIDSRKLPGNASVSMVTRQTSAPAAKKITNKIVPTDRYDRFIRKPTDGFRLFPATAENKSHFNVFLMPYRSGLINAVGTYRSGLLDI